jgi:hypothetical protein
MSNFEDIFEQSFDEDIKYEIGVELTDSRKFFSILDYSTLDSINFYTEDLDKLVLSLQKLQQHLKENK